MRRAIIVLMFTLSLYGCNRSVQQETEPPTDFSITEVPFTMDYNDKSIECKSVELYQSQVNYEWHPLMIIRFDTSNLTEEDIHWLTTSQDFRHDPDMDISVFYYSEQNDINLERMSPIEKYTNSDKKELTYIYYEDSSGTRKDFSDIEVHVSISLKQEKEHEVWEAGKKVTKNYIYHYEIRINSDKGEYITRDVHPESDITEEERQMFETGLADTARILGLL